MDKYLELNKLENESDIFKGISQIFLQDNVVCGLVFTLAVCFNNWIMGIALLVATIFGTLTAVLLKLDKNEINQGLYGFNAALVGVAMVLFFKPTIIVWILIVIGAVLSTLCYAYFLKKKIPIFTLPFIIITWIIYFSFKPFLSPATQQIAQEQTSLDFVSILSKSFGQVLFQNNIWVGIVFFLALAWSSKVAALFGLIGAILSAILAYVFDFPIQDINDGLLGYNAVLCAIVFADWNYKALTLAIFSIMLSFVCLVLLKYFNFLPLTFPFVLASILTLKIKNKFVVL
ncbi:MAG TPA: urea transporter [Chitinophagales bacterium]|nr:urea transporter [Chitinophagales bacterium]HMV02122.1 urea transporter [Chitinophagales bacterium]HMY42660.1 urea transporter [Chitinophagales bacterium]HMZ68676.1 urea transporter [Chitinophagales bacterium]HMZ93026.1 urea transporter [Chitinophagales bacterium]